jgi:hypothetical protein
MQVFNLFFATYSKALCKSLCQKRAGKSQGITHQQGRGTGGPDAGHATLASHHTSTFLAGAPAGLPSKPSFGLIKQDC